ncbi:hypothetical protein FHS02_004344 [Massilia umbonata]|uniref:Uncharacterized protein n=1 Tax=Pseudoduganella umbonata TaxID=864828 RepID=A0A7W5HEC2_9BURK|nr:hypothetical protein [Pseudoduganella umbonata]
MAGLGSGARVSGGQTDLLDEGAGNCEGREDRDDMMALKYRDVRIISKMAAPGVIDHYTKQIRAVNCLAGTWLTC